MKPTRIPIWTYIPEYHKEKKQILAAIERVFKSGTLILGAEVAAFEKEFAKFVGCTFGVGVGNGTDALYIGLKTLGVGPGDEVITVPNTAIPTASAIVAAGATPVFVDVDEKTYLMDPTKLEAAITAKTKCILPVHLYGQCCRMDAINKIAKKHKLFVLEDCAQAHGATWNGKPAGSMGDLGAYSFYPTKVLGAYGDAGMIVTNNKKLAVAIRMFRVYGTKGEYYSYFHGVNSRLDEVHAAILRTKLKHIRSYIKKRQHIARMYYKGLANTPLALPYVHPKSTHTYYLFVPRHPKRDEIIAYLKRHNIHVNISYKHPLHLMKAYQYLQYKKGDFPVAEQVASEIFSLPIYPELTEQEQNRIIKALQAFFQH